MTASHIVGTRPEPISKCVTGVVCVNDLLYRGGQMVEVRPNGSESGAKSATESKLGGKLGDGPFDGQASQKTSSGAKHLKMVEVKWCPGRDLNPHSPCGEKDFKSFASADFATRA